MRRSRSSNLSLALAAVLCAGGCQTTTVRSVPTTPSPPPRAVGVPAAEGPDDGRQMSADEAVAANASDASAGRLHDLEGALLMYDALHHRLPDRLDELKPLADVGTDLQVTAPSGQPYLYVPGGLEAVGTSKRIVVADPAPSPAGVRWCILAPPAAATGAALSMEVVAVPEAAFRQYVPAE